MKKLMFILASICLLAACEGPVGPQGPQGPAGEGNNWMVFDYTVQQRDWTLISDLPGTPVPDAPGTFYATEILVDRLSETAVLDGMVAVYRYDEANGVSFQVSLPYIRVRTDGTDTWQEIYDFDFATGSVMVYVTYDDFKTSRIPPTTMFRVVAVW